MKLITFLASATLTLNAVELPTDISKVEKPTTVKMLVSKLAEDSVIEAKGRFHVYDADSELLVDNGKNKWGRVTVTPSGLKWGDLYPGLYNLRIVPSDKDSMLLVSGIEQKGCLEIRGINGTVNLVNEIDAENYLKLLLSAKLKFTPSPEVLDALVIVERTNLYYTLDRNRSSSWQITLAEMPERLYPAITASVNRTKGTILLHNDRLFPAAWSKNAAGQTVSCSSLFRRGQSPAGVSHLPSQATKESSKWTLSISKKSFANLVGLKSITAIDLFKAEGSNKTYAARLTDGLSHKDIDFFTLQEALGPKLLRSSDFSVDTTQSTVEFIGYGEGPGVGLCLTTSEMLVKNHDGLIKILATHFPGAKLVKGHRADTGSFIWK